MYDLYSCPVLVRSIHSLKLRATNFRRTAFVLTTAQRHEFPSFLQRGLVTSPFLLDTRAWQSYHPFTDSRFHACDITRCCASPGAGGCSRQSQVPSFRPTIQLPLRSRQLDLLYADDLLRFHSGAYDSMFCCMGAPRTRCHEVRVRI